VWRGGVGLEGLQTTVLVQMQVLVVDVDVVVVDVVVAGAAGLKE
jgi:hypothetical protein